MEQGAYTAAVPKDLADLIPGFMENRQKDIETLRAAFAENNLEQLRSIAHRMKGIGSSYGFDAITAFGKHLEDAAKAGAIAVIGALLDGYDKYLANVTVTFV